MARTPKEPRLSFLFIDLELGRDGGFHAMAARRDGEERVWEQTRFADAHRALVAWLRADDVLVGHNLHAFDLPELAARAPGSPLLALPTLDTLELSVLAHPARPYHRLTKDDQLVRDARPSPLSDVRASEVVLIDALDALRALPDAERDLLRALLQRVPHAPAARRGWAHLFARLGWSADAAPLDLRAAWRGRVCARTPWLDAPAIDLGLVMIAAWLRVASRNDGSVLPAWVRRRWPDTPARLRALRATGCDDPSCDWCTVNLSPEHWLHEVFGFEAFRDTPRGPDGGPLQRALVARGLRGEATFGILPTGGGKSLCFQVPAETRHRLLGQLTVVISPLQSLMKDQVDALRDRIPHARAIYSGLPALLRPQVLDEVRSGACGLLYLSPEQFRNASVVKLLGQRDLGAIVFDEAHCLSQWGHDFRTDYPYVLNALSRLTQTLGQPMPPVFLFTATTQHDATAEIRAHVAAWTGTEPLLLDGGSARDNLAYVVRRVAEPDRLDVIVELLAEHLGEGAAIVFCGSRSRTEDTAEALTALGWPAVAYHAGLDADTRRTVQNAFLGGEHRVITATNAFGMGVDKADVRLVVHLDMPSSLEAYLQEAGRAGRDREPATAVLLWGEGDAEGRFALGALGDLAFEDLEALWRAIRQLPAAHVQGMERRVVTARELLFQEALVGRFDPYEAQEETRVKAAVNWLERAGVLARRENHTHVFSGRPRAPSLADAMARVDALDLPPARAAQWRAVLDALYTRGEEGLSADEVAVLCKALSFDDPLEGGLRVLAILDQMCTAGLVTAGQTFTAFIRHGVVDASARRLARWAGWERTIAAALVEEGLDEGGQVHLQAIADRLTDGEVACTVVDVARLLGTWGAAAQGLTSARGAVRFRHWRGSSGQLTVEAPISDLAAWLAVRQRVAACVLEHLIARVAGTGGQVLVASALEHLVAAVEGDLSLRGEVRDPSDAARGAVAWLHDLQILTVQNGLAVFRAAMQLDREPSWPGVRDGDGKAARDALATHQAHKVLRVHVMSRWAAEMLDDPARAERLRADWFALPLEAFVARWFPRQKQEIERPTTPESYRAIVTDLNDPVQQRIVTRDPRKNHLVLAGPGSGKTRILVHRVAWLLRCQRVRARQILLVCYTRANAIALRQRLHALVGRDAKGVSIQTLHGVAMSMVGPHRLGPDGDLTLDTCLPVAAAMLRGEALDASDQARQRDALLRGVNYLFIDEYQDIDAEKYALLSAIAGRAMDGDQRKLRVFAVGDDDQAIYTWDGASADFIRRFEADYQARREIVRHNYRNPAAVLAMAQALIVDLPDRLKAGETLEVDPARTLDPPMGHFATTHPTLRGRIPWHRATSVREAAHRALSTVRAWLDDGVAPASIGVLARNRPHGLNRLRIAAEALGVPFSWSLPSDVSVPVERIREVVSVLDLLADAAEPVASGVLADHLDTLGDSGWVAALRDWLAPNAGRRWSRDAWRYDLLAWARLERRARMIGAGVHLGTMHSAKGLEFDHVLLLDDGSHADTPEERRLLYVALTRARRSLQLFSSFEPSAPFAALRHPLLDVRDAPPLAADAPADHAYGLIGRGDLWIDWLGRQPGDHPGHAAMATAQPGDGFRLDPRGEWIAVVDEAGREVGRLSATGRATWGPRLDRHPRLKLVGALRERADDTGRETAFRSALRVAMWWTGVWEVRWREG